MNRRSPGLHVVLGAMLTLLACSSEAKKHAPATSTSAAPAAAAAEDAVEDREPEEAATESDTGTDEVIEIASDDEERPHNLLTAVAVEPTPATATWREVTSDDAPIVFEYVAGGVLAKIGDAYYERDSNGALVRLPDFELPEGELVGYWPDDAWIIHAAPLPQDTDEADADAGSAGFEYQLHQLGEDHEWTARDYRGAVTWTAEAQVIRKSWLAGVLVRDGSRLTRIGSLRPAGKIGPRMGKQILDVFETRSGRIYNIADRPNGVYVQRDCETRTCVQENARRLPHGHDWTFSMHVPRQHHSASMLGRVIVDEVEGVMLLHYETGGWKLESLTQAPRGLWPDGDGGLWMIVGEALWHRDVRGDWREVELPERVAAISAAMLRDHSELWLAATVGGRGVVYATPASLERAP